MCLQLGCSPHHDDGHQRPGQEAGGRTRPFLSLSDLIILSNQRWSCGCLAPVLMRRGRGTSSSSLQSSLTSGPKTDGGWWQYFAGAPRVRRHESRRPERREVPCIESICSEDDCGQQQPGLSGVCWYQGPLGPWTADKTVQSYGEPSH